MTGVSSSTQIRNYRWLPIALNQLISRSVLLLIWADTYLIWLSSGYLFFKKDPLRTYDVNL